MLTAISYRPIPIFDLGPLNLSLHGLFAGIGFAVGSWFAVREARRRGFDGDQGWSVMSWALVGALIGIRLFTIPAHLGDPGYGVDDVFSLSGDYSLLGGIAGGIIAGYLRLRMLPMPAKAFMDMGSVGLGIGIVIGRVGDLAIVEHLGSETSFFLGFEVRPGYELAPQHAELQRLCDELGQCLTYHHTALYDLLSSAVVLVVLLYLRRRWRYHYGQLIALWAALYGFFRFLIDFARLDAARADTVSDAVMGPFTGSQWGALGGAVLGLVLFFYFRATSLPVTAENDLALGADPEAVEMPAGLA